MGIIVGTMILVYILISFGVSFLIYKFSKKNNTPEDESPLLRLKKQ